MNEMLPARRSLPADSFLRRYAGLRARLPDTPGLHIAADQREQAAAAFARLGLPGPRNEAWKYTSLRPLADTEFFEPIVPIDGPADLLSRVPAFDAPRLVFVDGRLRRDLCTAPHEGGFSATPVFGTLAHPERDAFAALNTMLAEDGATIAIPAGVAAGTLQIVNLATDVHGRPVAFHPRHSITLGEGASLTLVEIALGDGVYLHNPLTEITVAAGAQLRHLRLQDESATAFHISTIYADVARGGTYDSFLLNMGSRLARNDVHARISGADGMVHLNCAQLLRGRQHGDFSTTLSHDAPNGQSRQTVRNVLDGAARGVFQGRINVACAAQKTDGYQMNHALLLSAEAEVDSKPELRINADDVKCSHGATVGELDADQLFYLRSRGVPAADARAMLIRGFLSESLADIAQDDVRALFEAAVDSWWTRAA